MLAQLLAREPKVREIDSDVDTRNQDGGVPFPKRLERAIREADLFVCLLGRTTLDSAWVRREIELAHTFGKVMIPVFQEHYT